MRVLFLFLSIALSLPALAARSYAIDLLIFQRTSPGSGEVFLPNATLEPPRVEGTPADWTPLSGGPLSGIAAKLKRTPGYRVLWHRYWRQTVHGQRGSSPIAIHVDRGGDTRVDGVISISARRFLHLDVDLLFRHGGAPVPFKAHQRMRSGETYYIDHPLGGIIVRVLGNKKN